MSIEECTVVKSVSTWDSGGGLEIDIIELHDGRVLGISEDVIILYENMDDLVSGEATQRPMIPL